MCHNLLLYHYILYKQRIYSDTEGQREKKDRNKDIVPFMATVIKQMGELRKPNIYKSNDVTDR